MEKLIIYTDGGARGNPGPAAVGIVIGSSTLLGASKSYRDYLGETTNNVAEYKAVIFALKKAKALLGGKKARGAELEINTDSDLLCNQVSGDYKIKEPHLQPLFVEIWNLKQDFKEVKFNLVPREKNRAADKLVNEELDSRLL